MSGYYDFDYFKKVCQYGFWCFIDFSKYFGKLGIMQDSCDFCNQWFGCKDYKFM